MLCQACKSLCKGSTFITVSDVCRHPRNQTAGAFALTAEQLWVLARLLKQQWAGHGEPRGPRPAIQRVQSATSFAAAAMEWLWLIDCGKLGNDSTPA
jgi:hypothetical protein